jgi:predicted 3-demethylubiquinone-9 3-methyltransferase (glyoxalase superfamily)
MQRVAPFLMFQQGNAEEAVHFYVATFPGSRVEEIRHWQEGSMGVPGKVEFAAFTVAGLQVKATDSPIRHGFDFTPALSLFVTCTTAEEAEDAFARLADGGLALMPMGEYPFAKRFGWLNDRFGVSWQIAFMG